MLLALSAGWPQRGPGGHSVSGASGPWEEPLVGGLPTCFLGRTREAQTRSQPRGAVVLSVWSSGLRPSIGCWGLLPAPPWGEPASVQVDNERSSIQLTPLGFAAHAHSRGSRPERWVPPEGQHLHSHSHPTGHAQGHQSTGRTDPPLHLQAPPPSLSGRPRTAPAWGRPAAICEA